MGIGTNMWGRGGRPLPGIGKVLASAIDAEICLVDTAEIYARGGSERSIGLALADDRALAAKAVILSKFFPWPWRLSKKDLGKALKGSLARLGMERLDIYLLHYPLGPLALETWVEALADVVDSGLVASVGISNCDADQVRRAHATLAKRGIPLACDEIEYSLLNRRSERDGTLAACNELGVRVIAYRPLALGLLPASSPTIAGFRKIMAPRTERSGLLELRELVAKIGEAHGGKTTSQVALNWAMRKGTIPIPGATKLGHLEENAGALGWELGPGEVEALDRASDRATGLLPRAPLPSGLAPGP
jgi:aryl-alcohol dehydrogenase-like predicted oxidoreductase